MNNFDCLNTVDGEILKGINIRQKKNILRPISNNYNDIDVGEPSCSNTSRWHNLESNHKRDFSTGFGFTSNYKGTVYRKHNIRDHTVIRKTRKKILSQRTKIRCPMRIMQLSVPTKRYCLETWRSNRDILPDFMVTIWITSILEESAYKILMEEFQELKEVEGPVWDLIDQLIDNVVVVCEPMTVVSSSISQLSLSSISKSVSTEKQSLIINTQSKSNKNGIGANTVDNKYENESIIDYILDNIAYNVEALGTDKEDSVNKNKKDATLHTSNDIIENNYENVTDSNVPLEENKTSHHHFNRSDVDVVQKLDVNEIDSQINNTNNIDNDSKNLDDSDITKQINIMATSDEGSIGIIKTSTEVENNLNGADNNISRNGSQEEMQTTPDDSIKKVKFSNLNIGVNSRKTGISDDSNSIYVREGHYHMPINLSEDGSIKPELHLAPPNDNLLSDADESWPENLQFPVLKATVSVSKSIMSLGNILENEEKELTTDEKDNISNEDRKISLTHTIQADKNEEIEEDDGNIVITETEKYTRENYTNTKNKHYKQNNFAVTTPYHVDVVQEQIAKIDTFEKENIAVKLIIERMPVIDIYPKENFHYNRLTHEKSIQTEQEVINNIFKQIASTVDILPSYKIFKESKAICSCGTFIKGYDIKESEIRKWCHGLENVMQNLELWIEWVEITCNYIISFNHKVYKADKRKEDNKYMWTKLIINIDLDSKTWRKISKRLRRGITNYKSFYVKPRTQRTKSCNYHQLLQISQLCQKGRTCICKRGLHDL
ncbi:superoxide-generating NADPH oxidase heavy chain subunit C-like [Vanessa atalanta]|uniref:superoxide-generating NADPH oxidase heavy chain subunit C-like n=1 Tax=Vanessa atalanta TaxID=42275 RepID=UPI001FCCC7DB|nr:superoxide-generating NADPH oxidase heavy chain subunit C-like [Vanessa atalanta]